MFAGPNGSGKSSLKAVIKPEHLGIYLNADEMAVQLASGEGFSLQGLPFTLNDTELASELEQTGNLRGADPAMLRVENGHVFLESDEPGYYAAALAEVLRRRLLQARATFSFETVMSHTSKVDLMQTALDSGYRTYLYYVATESVEINVSRVQLRVKQGGHDVPEDKIRERYVRSLALLPNAIRASTRAFVFDNSTEHKDRSLVAEFERGSTMTLHIESKYVPGWFTLAVLDKLNAD